MSAIRYAYTAPLLAWLSEDEWQALIEPDRFAAGTVAQARGKIAFLQDAKRRLPVPERGQVWADMNGKMNTIGASCPADRVLVDDVIDIKGERYVIGKRLATGRPTKIRLDRFFGGVGDMPKFVLVELPASSSSRDRSPLDEAPSHPGQVIGL